MFKNIIIIFNPIKLTDKRQFLQVVNKIIAWEILSSLASKVYPENDIFKLRVDRNFGIKKVFIKTTC